MRKLLWFTLGFGAACFALAYWLSEQLCLPLAVGVFLLSLFCFLLGRNVPAARVPAVALLGFTAACLWYQGYAAFYLAPVAQLDGRTQEAEIVTIDDSYVTDYGIGVDGMIHLEGKNYQIRVFLDAGEPVLPGTRLHGLFRFRMTVSERMTSHPGEGIFLLAYQKGEVVRSQSQEENFLIRISGLRHTIKENLAHILPEDTYPFAKALLLGDTTDLSYEVDTNLKVSGIRHVVAVSGLHVSILFALIGTITFRNRYLSAVLGIPTVIVFAAVAGFTPSVNRACLMSALMLVGQVLDREYDGLTALSFAVLAMLLGNPFAVTSVSLQLSAVSVAGIFLFSEPIAKWLRSVVGSIKGKSLSAKGKRWLITSVSTTLSAMVLTTPLCAWYFGTVSLVGILTNLLTLWMISIIFYGLLAANLLFLVSPAAAIVVGQTTAWLIRYVLWVAKILSQMPVACIYTQSEYIVFWLVFAYILFLVFALSKDKKPLLLGCCAGIGLCAALLLSYLEPGLYSTNIAVLDVGQGQCIVLQSQGKTYLVDCGAEDDTTAADTAAQYLLSRGISRLDGLILTHMDQDHSGGVSNLLTQVDADVLVVPPVSIEIDCNGVPILAADREVSFCWGNSKLTVYGEKLPQSNNENSICILFDTEKCDILITGDRDWKAEARLLQKVQLPKVDVLIAGHHGSAYATSEQLLDAVCPQIVCISAGADNIYGHPAPQTLKRLQSHGCDIYRTDLHGTIAIRR